MSTNTYRTFEQMTTDPKWEGWGYLGGRERAMDEGHDVTDADRQVIEHAEAHGWTDADLFTWANSRSGRWFAEAITDPAYRTRHAAKLLVVPVEAV